MVQLQEQAPPRQAAASPINVSQRERTLSLAGGAALMVVALLQRSMMSLPAIAGGFALLYRGLTGNSQLYKALGRNTAVKTNRRAVSVPHEQGVHAKYSLTINRPISDLYAFWRDFTNLPQVINYIESVRMSGDNRFHWTMNLPGGHKAEAHVEIYTDVPNEVISWRSLPDSNMQTAGAIRFQPAPADQGTEVSLTIEFVPPGGPLAQAVLNLFGDVPNQVIGQMLREFKQVMETGEKATTEGQTSGRKSEVRQ